MLYKLQADDVQGMLCEAAKVLTSSEEDRQIMRQLIASAANDPDHKWNRASMATMLAKAGKMHEAELVLGEIPGGLLHAQAALKMGLARLAAEDRQEGLGLLRIAINHAHRADPQLIVETADVLSEAALALANLGEIQEARSIADAIKSPSHRQRVLAGLQSSGAA